MCSRKINSRYTKKGCKRKIYIESIILILHINGFSPFFKSQLPNNSAL